MRVLPKKYTFGIHKIYESMLLKSYDGYFSIPSSFCEMLLGDRSRKIFAFALKYNIHMQTLVLDATEMKKTCENENRYFYANPRNVLQMTSTT